MGRNDKYRTPCVDCGSPCDKKSPRCRPCSNLFQRGTNHPNYKNGKSYSNGYLILTGQYDHPNAQKNGHLLEHVKVMSQKLGRALRPDEIVHHINGIRDDNRPENLELCNNKRQPPGQRVADMVHWAREILRDYGDEFPE